MHHRYGRLVRYPLHQWPMLLAILALTLASATLVVLHPLPLKLLVDNALQGLPLAAWLGRLLGQLGLEPTPAFLVVLAALSALGLFVLNSFIDIGLHWSWSVAGQRMVYDLASGLFHRLTRLSLAFHSRHSVGDSVSRITEDAYSVYTLTGSLLVTPIQHLATLSTIGAVAWRMDPTMTMVIATVAPVMATIATFFGPRIKRRARAAREERAHLISFVHQTLAAIPMVQAYGAEPRNRDQFDRLADRLTAANQRDALVNKLYTLATGVIGATGSAVVLYLGSLQVLRGSLTIGTLLIFLAYVRTMQEAFSGLFRLYGSVRSAEAGVDRVLEILDIPDGVVRATEPIAHLPPPRVGRALRFDHVTFGYESQQPVLTDISLTVAAGSTVALVGATGAGKSTLASLIPRFLDPWTGSVYMDDYDIRQLDLADVRGQVAFVLQDPFLLPLTVAQNIAYGRPSATHREIVAAAEAARADSFIRRLPRGYDTVIGEHGATLSGGECQRLAIARALLKDAPILILDEPTAALDGITESELLAALERLLVGRTVIIIAHRFSTIRYANQIVVLEQGRIVEQGAHQELLAAGGAYARLYSRQASVADREVRL